MILRSLPSIRALLALFALAACAGYAGADDTAAAPTATDDGAHAGVLGRHHISLSYDFYQLANPGPFDRSATGSTLAANFRLARPVDFSLRYATATVDGPLGLDLRREEFIGAVTLHHEFRPGDSVFFRLGYGTMAEEIAVRQRGRAWEFAAGFEFLVSDNFSLTPALDYIVSRDLDITEVRLGLTADLRLGRHWSALARVRHASVREETDYQQYSIGLNLKF